MMEMFKRQGLDKNIGLGKKNTGIKEPIQLPFQKGRAGFGHKASEVNMVFFMQEFYIFYFVSRNENLFLESSIFLKKEVLDDEDRYCDADLLKKMLGAKTIFDELSDNELIAARARANPFETIKSGFFQNRAAMKAANMDSVFQWIFTDEDKDNLSKKNPLEGCNTDRNKPLFYFADVCAGPGGFSEYVLWRKGFYNAKGFGFTLKGKDDFKLNRFTAASPVYFEPFYGKYGDGDVTRPENIVSFEKLIQEATGKGVYLMMADGGFSVEGEENIQEIRSKRLYLCQFLVALSVVREGGVFFCKLFDIFTPFSIGLIYLMYIAFDRISLHKPKTSRPANSERYIICKGLRKTEALLVKDFFTKLNNRLSNYQTENSEQDIYEILPQDYIDEDTSFFNYVKEHNDGFLKNQILYLEKYKIFAKDLGKVDLDQGRLRDECMDCWKLPKVEWRNKNKFSQRRISMMDSLNRLCMVGQLIEFSELRKPRPPFLQKHAESPCTKGVKYEELRFCVLSGKSDRCLPKILFSNVKLRIFTFLFEGRNFPKSRYVFRILDAAVIDSDDIFNLPFDERIKAAEKMCSAVRMFGLNKDSCNVFTAEVNPWHLVWSTTQNNYYLFNATTGESMMCSKNTDGVATFTKFKGADCFTTFFDAISCKREE
uniref:Cap-specific mRNA (nucleoside-2'-O-)-methyltransferase 1 n=1 Tax=Syphacia muris TaxID=451379 RepID=A0A0N5ARN0_9BILA